MKIDTCTHERIGPKRDCLASGDLERPIKRHQGALDRRKKASTFRFGVLQLVHGKWDERSQEAVGTHS